MPIKMEEDRSRFTGRDLGNGEMTDSKKPTSRLAAMSGLMMLLPIIACVSMDSDPATEVSEVRARLVEARNETDDPHADVMKERFPSATACRVCHPRQYQEWSVSPHAYAQLSPVFNAMHNTINRKMNGTLGDFCIRCHTPVGMAIEEELFISNVNRHPVAVEGVTCISCHRMSQEVGKVSGRRPLREGGIVDPVYGPTGGDELKRVIADADFGVVTDSTATGRKIHGEARKFSQLSKPEFCGACHDVNLPNGFRFEEAFSEYRRSPAAARGETCQDCHMGKEPGIKSGYHFGPAAVVGGEPTRDRKITSHTFVGPDYSIVHPGLFPHSPDAKKLATMAEWLLFDHEAGWGTDDFEDEVADDYKFPSQWESADDRYDAREVLDEQFKLLENAKQQRLTLLKRGYLLSDIQVDSVEASGVEFHLDVANGTDGHLAPTGFTAERLVFIQIEVIDSQQRVIFRSGDLDPNGDLRDSHSLYVHNGELLLDEQLFSLQSKFVTTNVRGGEREQVLSVNNSIDALPFLRPATSPTTLTGRPRGARIHKYGIAPNDSRKAAYSVPANSLTGMGTYEIRARLIAAMVPVNLVAAISEVGFDYGLSAREVAKRVVDGHQVLWERKATIYVK
ncbi:MAG: hypothetical protein ACI97A_003667 [Planctomycetota bacterium]|jgi:hypothetical protein